MPKKSVHKITFLQFISRRTKFLFILGLILIFIPTLFYINETIQLMYVVPPVQTVVKPQPGEKVYTAPIAIDIPAVNIKLPVEETTVRNNVWGISSKGASHLFDSANPGQSGPIIFYGHNTNDRFGPIRWLKKGKQISVTTADTKIHRYTIVDTLTVDPNQLAVFFSRKQETLYLYTCDGFADLKRFIIIAEPEKEAAAAS
jgi:LPXTG-site transpeptidase (sortase) family protein